MKFKSFQNLKLNNDTVNDLSYFIGVLRDGCFTKKETNGIYRIRVYQKDKEFIEMLFKKLTNFLIKKPIINLDSRTGVWCLSINSKGIYEEIVKLSEYPGSQKDWITPKWILSFCDSVKKEYVKGFFDAEGGVPHLDEKKFKNKNINIYFSQGNKEVLEELKFIINNFGIKTGKVCGPYYKKGYENPQYALKIHGINQVVKFYNIFDSNHPLKIKRLNLIRNLSK